MLAMWNFFKPRVVGSILQFVNRLLTMAPSLYELSMWMIVKHQNEACLFVLFVFVALRPMSTAMVIAGRSVYLTTLFPGQA